MVLAALSSGNRSTVRPFASVYWVIPSTEGPCVTPGGSAAATVVATKAAGGEQGGEEAVGGVHERGGFVGRGV